MTEPILDVVNFSHICIAVSDMERSLRWYRDVFGVEVVFDVELAGAALETVTGEEGAAGRMVGMRVPGSGVVVELLDFGRGPVVARPPAAPTGYSNISLTVPDVDAARVALEAAGERPGPVAEFDGVRMLFLTDPDHTPIEVVEYPFGATSNLEYQHAKPS